MRAIRRYNGTRLLYGFPGSYQETPSYWNLASDETVSLKQDTPLWREVESMLLQTSDNRRRILAITLVCKRNMFKLYQAKKDAFQTPPCCPEAPKNPCSSCLQVDPERTPLSPHTVKSTQKH